MRRAAIGLFAAMVGVVGCAGRTIREQTRATSVRIAAAHEQGALRCAPVELAMAEAHNDFAAHALDEGDYYDARREAAIADKNARLALDKSPKDRCTGTGEPAPNDSDGDGIVDTADRCPRVAEDKDGFQDEDGCPEDDNDADGLADKIDRCPLDAEDRDNYDDDDGCPDPDNDSDGLSDKVDSCPAVAEDRDGFEDDDGCPDPDNDKDGIVDTSDKCPNEPGVAPDGCKQAYTHVVVTETKIELKQTVFFDTNRASIKPVSFALLDDVAKALKDNPKITVEIQGHTDSQGDDRTNKILSQKRAESVRAYVVKKGVAAARMTAKGYGEDVPITDNRTPDGRSQNRRVEFVITAR